MSKTIEDGYYSAEYFNKARTILRARGAETPVTMQVFQKDYGVLAGMSEAVSIIQRSNSEGKYLKVMALKDGDTIEPFETVMTIEGNLADFVHLESVYLGVLARSTRVASNMRKIVDAANGKPVLFMGDRFDRYENQESDGEAALIGGAYSICTEAMGWRDRRVPGGTMPHALIAAFGGDLVAASRAYLEAFPDHGLTALVDFNNDCVGDSLAVLREFGTDLKAVRLDTSEKMTDKSLQHFPYANTGTYRGVNDELVHLVREALDANGGQHVKIIVSGGFTVDKISRFESQAVPVDMYGVGSSIIKGGADFTADVVKPVGKAGRPFRPNPRLREV